jgi:hypothetical protein
MKTRFAVIIGLVFFATVMGATWAGADSTGVDSQRRFFLKCIDQEIANYSGKVELVNSSSENLREYGSESARKVVFLVKNRQDLAEEMTAQKISMRSHAVHQFLNTRFHQDHQLASTGK